MTPLPALGAALLLTLPSGFAAKPASMTASVWWSDYQNPVEQQTPGGALQPDRSLWVTNPTIGTTAPAIWDPDDSVYVIFGGWLPAHGSYTFSVPLIGDWVDHLIGVSSDRFDVSVSDGQASAADCLIGPHYDRDYAGFVPIEGSNGGVGVPQVITWTITNPTDRRVKGTASGIIRLADGASRRQWCTA